MLLAEIKASLHAIFTESDAKSATCVMTTTEVFAKWDSCHGVIEVKKTKNPELSVILRDLFLANRAALNRIQLYNE